MIKRKYLYSLILILSVVGAWLWAEVVFHQVVVDYQDQLEKKVEEYLSVDFEVARIETQLFPFSEIIAENVSFDDPSDCEEALELKSIRLLANPLLLLLGDLRIEEIDLDGLDGGFELKDNQLVILTDDIKNCTPNKPWVIDLRETKQSAPNKSVTTASDSDDIDFAVDHIDLDHFNLSIKAFGAELRLEDLMLSSSFAVEDGRRSLRNSTLGGVVNGEKLRFRSKTIQTDPKSGLLKVSAGELSIGKDTIKLSMDVRDWADIHSLDISTEHFDLEKLKELLTLFGESSLSGTVKLNLQGKKEANGSSTFSGSIAAKDLTLPGGALNVKSLKVNDLQFSSTSDGLSQSSGAFQLEGFRSKDGTDTHEVKIASGKLTSRSSLSGTQTIQGAVDVDGYLFADDVTRVEKVQGNISDLKVQVLKNGDTEVSLQLKSKSVQVANPDFTLNAVKQVTTPLKISIPGKGGYSVTGPVTFTGVEFQAFDANFLKSAGTVDMIVSSKLKQFGSKKISVEVGEEEIALNTLFVMTDKAYEIKDNTTIKIRDGKLEIAAHLARSEPKPFSATLNAVSVPVHALMKIAQADDADDYLGMLNKLEGSFKGDLSQPLQTLLGSGNVAIGQQLSRRFNLTESIFTVVKKIPGVSYVAPKEEDSDKERDYLTSADFEVGKEKVHLKKITSERLNFTFTADAEISFDETIDGKGKVVFLEKTVSSLGFGIKPLARLTGSVGRVSLPLSIGGTLSKPGIGLDAAEFARQYSGYNTVRSAVGTVRDVITSPFRKSKESPTPEASATP